MFLNGVLTNWQHYVFTDPQDAAYMQHTLNQQLGNTLPAASLARTDGLSELLLPGEDLPLLPCQRQEPCPEHTHGCRWWYAPSLTVWGFCLAALCT